MNLCRGTYRNVCLFFCSFFSSSILSGNDGLTIGEQQVKRKKEINGKSVRRRLLMDKNIQYILEVARCGGITKAANKLYITPSALSRFVQARRK